MSTSFQVFRGTKDGSIVSSETSSVLTSNQVFIETTHSGVCGTDEIFLHSGQALGHEGVGIVRQVSPGVHSVQVGDRVGFGYVRKVCGSCDSCMAGKRIQSMTLASTVRVYGECDFDIGSFGSGVVWDADCLFPIPQNYKSEHAAALMCAGASVWECLQDGPARPGERVGVLGVGGLGHLAVKLASSMGCEVVVLSTSESKREDAMSFGASEFHVFNQSAEHAQKIQPLKRLLLCSNSSSVEDFTAIVPHMDTSGVIYPLTVSFGDIKIPLLAVMAKGLRIQGTRCNITPDIMTFPLTSEGIETSMHELREGRIKYRAVLIR
ncbi:alcohol dehydrogenase [Fusarium globosum]|uniref:Alcohol dehydrogenase n=1 Tax=Fusarium globosum TaxID=78864 RepID=A0A8H5XMQ8_9HYPO|nr:alcohol dehydrogenase [Fusarium globosum]